MSLQPAAGLTRKIMIAMVAGLLLGILINLFLADVAFVREKVVDGALKVIGAVFVAALKMMVVPLVFVSLVGGVTSMGDVRTLGRIGSKALGIYVCTTMIAVTIALALAAALSPGKGMNLETKQAFTPKEAPALSDVIIGMVPSNPVQAMAEGNMLQVIVFALLVGVAITLAGDRGKHVLDLFNDLNAVIMKMVDVVMALAPLGIFALITRTFAGQGIDMILPMAGYFLVVAGALLVHAGGTFSVLLGVFAGLNPLRFFLKMRPVMLFAFSTASSSATIPVNLKTVEDRLGASNSVAAFTVPLGATINMDGTAIMQGVATVFISNVYGVNLSLSDYLSVVMTATLASIGTAGVPGVGLIMLAMVLSQVGLPVEGIALIIGVDRVLDMMRTAINVVGDAVVTCLVAKSEDALNMNVFLGDDSIPSTTAAGEDRPASAIAAAGESDPGLR